MKRRTSLTNVATLGKIRFLCFVAIAVNLSGSAAFALDPMGPPRAGMKQGEFSIGANLAYSETDFDLVNGKWVNPGTTPTTGDPGAKTITDFEAIKLYATAGYGFAKNWEAFLGIGAAKAEFGDSMWGQGEDFDSGIGLGVRGGVKTTIFEIPERNLEIGGLLQLNWANYDGKLNVPEQTAPDFVELDLTEMQIAVGATYLYKEGVTFYGGPFVYYISGDLQSLTIEGYDITWDIDEGPVWGAYLGAQLDLAKNCVFNIEYLHSSDASVLGAGLIFTY